MCLYPTTGAAPQSFSSALQFFAAAQCLITENWPPESYITGYEEFDFIIVGAGSAGCVVANRLSEVYNWKILLIEAGSDPPVESTMYSLSTQLFFTAYDWGFTTIDDHKTSQGIINGSVYWPMGKMLGGSSSINGMLYVRGNSNDYLKWYEAGNKEWHPNVVYKYFKKAESLQDEKLLKNPTIRSQYGKDGPLVVNSFNMTYADLAKKILASYEEIGIKNVLDLNTANYLGSGLARATAYNGIRGGTAKAYLTTILNRKNLKILKNTFVRRILIDNATKRAYAVEVERNGRKMKYFARFEVILSAGVVNTPHLLLLSGIGPKEHLHAKNITCKVDIPMVGKNLQEQAHVPVFIFGNEPKSTHIADQHFEAIKFLHNRTGTLANNVISDVQAFYSLEKNATFPDVHFHLSIYPNNSAEALTGFKYIFRYKEPILESIAHQIKNHSLYMFSLSLSRPFSRGYISLNTSYPKDYPLIHPKYFDDPKDLETAVKGIKIMTKMVNTTYFRSIEGYLGDIGWPTCNKFVINSTDYWKCICTNMVTSTFHQVGTSKMGSEPKTSVVDGRLRVHGVKGLRVIDASVMPFITSGNTNAPTIMIAERGSDLIKEDYRH